MKTLLTGGRIWQTDGSFLENESMIWEDGIIVAVGHENCKGIAVDRELRVCGMTVLPGLVDVHTHGRAGYDFCTATEEEMRLMRKSYQESGVTSVFATLASGTQEEWLRAIQAIEAAGYEGIHFEGNYLNPQKRGAHAPALLVPLDADELEIYLSAVHIPCHMTAAFELDRDGSFTSRALQYGATLGLGHTAATAAEAKLAMSRGVTSFSHLYNTMPPLHHREGGAVAAALTGDAYAELIADGLHICPDMIALAYRCLGNDKTVLITDSMMATGKEDGEYAIAGQPVIVKDGKALTLDGALAGSTLNLWDGVKNLMQFASIPLSRAIACATINPARMVGIDQTVGSIEVGKRADLLLVDEDTMTVKRVIAAGV